MKTASATLYGIRSLLFFLFFVIPCVSLAKTEDSQFSDHNTYIETEIKSGSFRSASDHKVVKKKILAGDRKLGAFFTIGLIINLVMIATFVFWATGQWKKNNKTKK